jgi:hypothetical protein
MEKVNLTGVAGQVVQVVLDSAPLAASFAAYSGADAMGKSTAVKALAAVGVGILTNILKGFVERNVVTISGLTLERVGMMPQLRTRTDQRRGYGALTLEQLSGCRGCGY